MTGDLARGAGHLTAADNELDSGSDLGELDPERVQNARRDAFALADQAEQQVLGPDVVVVEADRLVLGEGQDAFGSVVETIEGTHRNREYALLVRPLRLQRREEQAAL